MRSFFQWLLSSVGKKYLLAVTGLALVGFLVTHLAANLTLLAGDGGTMFNTYPHQLQKWGGLLIAAELGLLGVFIAHLGLAIAVTVVARRARGLQGHPARSKGGASHFSPASRGMIFTGLAILVFVVVHVFHFKFGPGEAQGYITDIAGEPARDLYRLVAESFTDPRWVAFYCAAMLIFGFHIRHGIWSAFQSLGLMTASASPRAYWISWVIAVLMAGGFFVIPLVLWLRGGVS